MTPIIIQLAIAFFNLFLLNKTITRRKKEGSHIMKVTKFAYIFWYVWIVFWVALFIFETIHP